MLRTFIIKDTLSFYFLGNYLSTISSTEKSFVFTSDEGNVKKDIFILHTSKGRLF